MHLCEQVFEYSGDEKKRLGLSWNRNFRASNTGGNEPRIEGKVKNVCTKKKKDLELQVKKRACQKLRKVKS